MQRGIEKVCPDPDSAGQHAQLGGDALPRSPAVWRRVQRDLCQLLLDPLCGGGEGLGGLGGGFGVLLGALPARVAPAAAGGRRRHDGGATRGAGKGDGALGRRGRGTTKGGPTLALRLR